MDYSITWGYIVQQMEEKFGIKSDDSKKYSFSKIETMLSIIWNEYFEKLYSEEMQKTKV